MIQTVSISGFDLRLFRAVQHLNSHDIYPTAGEAMHHCLAGQLDDDDDRNYAGCVTRLRDAGLLRIIGERECDIAGITDHQWEAIR